MLKSRTVILSLTLSSALALAPAKAADTYSSGSLRDVPFVSASNWTGFYAGANGGYGWSPNNVLNGSASQFQLHLSPKGAFGGGEIGYNWQGVMGPSSVFGFETDIQGAGIEDHSTLFGTRVKASLDWFGSVRGRIGYVLDSSLLYVTGGLAYGEVDHEISWLAGNNRITVTGLVIGGGYELKLNPAWSVKAEYQYFNFGKNEPRSVDGTPASAIVNSRGDVSTSRSDDDAFHTVRFGLNYHPGASYEPLK
jgi:outer membrane immunogenic protein